MGRGNGSYPVLLPSFSRSLPPSLRLRHTQGGGAVVCAVRVGWGVLHTAEDDSLGCGPDTLGKARPALGQSPRERQGGRGACVCLSCGENPGGSKSLKPRAATPTPHLAQQQKCHSAQRPSVVPTYSPPPSHCLPFLLSVYLPMIEERKNHSNTWIHAMPRI